jgi:pimeloyl-ACP methyl ester carboxylesterase
MASAPLPGVSNAILRRHVTIGGRRISYLSLDREPKAAHPVIVLIHGSGVNARCWIEQIRGLRAARVIAIDLPGHGQSHDADTTTIDDYADVVAAFLVTLRAVPAIIVGHSLGGAIALALAARYTATIHGLVLVSTCARLPSSSVAAEWLLPFLPGPVRKAMFFSTAQALLFAPGASARAVNLGMRELRACRPETLARDVAMSRAMDFTEVAKALRVPTLVLCGSRDQVTPPVLAADLHASITGSRLSIVEGAGHMVLVEAPDVVNREIDAFADAVAAAQRVRWVESQVNRRARPRRWCRSFQQWAASLPVRYAPSRRGHRADPRSSPVFMVVPLASTLPLQGRRRPGVQDAMTDDGGWWSEIDDDVLACLRDGPMSTTELGQRLRLSPAALSSVLLMLAAEGRVRVDTVNLATARREPEARG